MRVLVLLDAASASSIDGAISHRGHRVIHPREDPDNLTDAELGAADLIIADAELANRAQIVARVAATSPGVEFVLVGPRSATVHPDVFEQVERPIDLDRLLAILDDIADILDGERLREPMDLVAYETVFAGDSPEIRDLLRRVRLVARSEAPVWIFGDDGSGRAIIARVIHDRSPRRMQPFVAFNTAAYADEELSRILFRGDDAAVKRARGGTLFLERIGAAGPSTQRELVHFLESRETAAAHARVIVGVQRDHGTPGAQVIAPELFYQLKVLEIEIPALKERVRDLEHIVDHMLRRLAPDKEPEIADEAMSILERYSFPGNLLELAHALTHAFVLARGTSIQPQHLPVSIREAAGIGSGAARQPDGDLESLDVVAKRFERDYLLRVLRSVAGNRGRAAEILGLSRKGLWGKLKAHGISDSDIEGG